MFLDIDKHLGAALKDAQGEELTYAQLTDEVIELGSALSSRSLVFCICENVIGCALGYLAMVEAGTVPVMLSADLAPELLERLDGIYRPCCYWAPAGFREGKSLVGAHGYELTPTGYDNAPLHDELQLCMSTSGSTGDPKLVRYKKGNLEVNAQHVAEAFGWTPEERGLCDLGLNYTMGLNVMNSHLKAGACALLCDLNPVSSAYWDFLRNERATNLTGVPFSYEIFARLRFTRMDLPDLKTIAEGGGKLSDKRFVELAEYAASTGRRFFATFGTTETAARLSYLPPELALEKTGSIGRAIPGGRLTLLDSDGNELPDGPGTGEMCYSGPNVTMGYARRREDLLLGDEWNGTYRTGDLARRDDDGCYYVTGRISRFLKLLGHRVSLDQCERILADGLGATCACVGDDEHMRIYVEGDGELANRCARYLSEELRLRATLFQAHAIDKLPRNTSGKIAYRELG